MYLVISKNKTQQNRYGLLTDDNYLLNNVNNNNKNNNKLVPKINTLSKQYIPYEKWKVENDFYIYMLTNDIIKQLNSIKINDITIYIIEEGIEENISRMLYKLSNNRYK